jgi:hypothetical protein
MAIYKAIFETQTYKRDGDTLTHTGKRHDGRRLFSELTKPENWNFLVWHPQPQRPRNADKIMHTTRIEEYNPRRKQWDFVMSESY